MRSSRYQSSIHARPLLLLLILSLFGTAMLLGTEDAKAGQTPLKVVIAPDSDLNLAKVFSYSYAKFAHNYSKHYDIHEATTTVMIGEITAQLIEKKLNDLFQSPDQIGGVNGVPQATLLFHIKAPRGEVKHDFEVIKKNATTYYVSKIINTYKARFEYLLDYELKTLDGKAIVSGSATGLAKAENNSYKQPAIQDAVSMAARQAVTAMANKLSKSKAVLAYVQSEKKRIAARIPGKLNLSVSFSDRDAVIPNHALDAGEKAQLQVQLHNQGPGSATDIKIDVQSDVADIIIKAPFSAGDLAPGSQKTVTVPISAKLSISSMERLPLNVRATDAKGADSQWVESGIPAIALDRPELGIRYGQALEQPATDVNDGDGVIENGEAVRIEQIITNSGHGKAFNVKVDIAPLSEGLEVVAGNDLIHEINSGQSRKVQFAFKIPRNYSNPEFRYTIRAADIRGPAIEKSFTVPIVINKPNLVASVQLINAKAGTSVVQGTTATCTVTVRNTGTMDAHDVSMRLYMPAQIISFDQTTTVGRLAIGQSRSQDFTFNVASNAPAGDLPVMVDIFESKNKAGFKKIVYQIAEKPKPVVKHLGGENDIVMVVGLSRFKNQTYTGVKNASGDATTFHRFLLSDDGGAVPNGNMALLTDQAATLDNIKRSLQKLLAQATAKQTLSVFWVTHGIIDGKGKLNLLCYDSDTTNLSQSALGEADLFDLFGAPMKAKKVVFYLDLCHPPINFWTRDLEKKCLDEYAVNSRIGYITENLSQMGQQEVVAFSGSSAPGGSLSATGSKGSIFTQCIIDGLKGKANHNGDQWVTAKELDAYLTGRILSESMGLQRPRTFFKTAQTMLLHKQQ